MAQSCANKAAQADVSPLAPSTREATSFPELFAISNGVLPKWEIASLFAFLSSSVCMTSSWLR